MTGDAWRTILRTHCALRRPSLRGGHGGLVFVACSDSVSATELLAAFPDAYVLQNLARAAGDHDLAARASLEYAVVSSGAGRVVLVGHSGCRERPTGSSHLAGLSGLVAHGRALRADPWLGPVLDRERVVIEALWCDDDNDQLCSCDLGSGRATRLRPDDLARMFTRFDGAWA